MHAGAIVLFGLGLVFYGASLFLPANHEWLGFLWAAFAVEAVARGPQFTADYPLFVMVTTANLLFVLAALAFPFKHSASARLLPYPLLLAAAVSVWARFTYRPQTWAAGFDVWYAALAAMAVALLLRTLRSGKTQPAMSIVRERQAVTTAAGRRKSGTR